MKRYIFSALTLALVSFSSNITQAQYLGFYYMGYDGTQWEPLTDMVNGSITMPTTGSGLVFSPQTTSGAYLADSATAPTAALGLADDDTFSFSFTMGNTAGQIDFFQIGNVSASWFGTTYVPYTVKIDLATDQLFTNIIGSDTLNITPFIVADTFAFQNVAISNTLASNTQYFLRSTYFNSQGIQPTDKIFGDDYFIQVIVPEPSTTALLVLGIVGISYAGLSRRRLLRVTNIP